MVEKQEGLSRVSLDTVFMSIPFTFESSPPVEFRILQATSGGESKASISVRMLQ